MAKKGTKSAPDKGPLDRLSSLSLGYNLGAPSAAKALNFDGMFGTSDPVEPGVPNPLAVGAAQTGTNVSTAIANALLGHVDQTGPYGSIKYSQTGTSKFTDPTTGVSYDIPNYSADTSLSAAGQAQQDQLDKAGLNLSTLAADQSGRIGDMLSKPVNMDGLPDLTQDFSADRQKVEDALFARLNPQLERARAQRETDLTNRGIRLGSDSYDRAQGNLSQGENDARLAAILASGQEQSRLAQLNSATRAQGVQERFATRNQPINEITALMTGGQVTQPNFSSIGGPTIPTTDYASLTQNAYKNQQDAYARQLAAQQGNTGALAGLVGAGIAAFSDENLKKDIEPMGGLGGHSIYAYRYKGEAEDAPKTVGVMAQEVERTRPDAVIDTPVGKAVNYHKLGLAGLGGTRAA